MPGAASPASYAYILAPQSYKTRIGNDDLSASINGALFEGWAGPINGALTAEIRAQLH